MLSKAKQSKAKHNFKLFKKLFLSNLFSMYKRIILFIALISFLLSCNNSHNTNINVNTNNTYFSSVIYEDIIEEEIIEEEIIYEDIIYEDIIYEDILYEEIINEIIIFEDTLNENIIVEDIDMQFTTIKDFEDNFDNCFSSDALMYDIDWAGDRKSVV